MAESILSHLEGGSRDLDDGILVLTLTLTLIGGSRTARRDGTLVLVGHDGDLDALSELFGLSWHGAPFPPNATTPGSSLRLDINADGLITSRIFYTDFSSNPKLQNTPARFNWVEGTEKPWTTPLVSLKSHVAPKLDSECLPAYLKPEHDKAAGMIAVIIVGSIGVAVTAIGAYYACRVVLMKVKGGNGTPTAAEADVEGGLSYQSLPE